MVLPRVQNPEPTTHLDRLLLVSYRGHVLALALIVGVITIVIGVDSVFSPDEGAALHQARFLVDYGRWGLPSTFPEVDPSGQWFPLRLSHMVDDGLAPLAKRPLYPATLSVFYRLSPTWGPVSLSVLGTLVAAAASGLIARRIRPVLDRPTLWVVGLASPLLFDSQLIMAHTLAAAALTVAVLAALRFLDQGEPGSLVVVLAGLTLGGLVRTEALLLMVAVALAALITTRLSIRGGGLALVSLAAIGLSSLVDRLWLDAIGTRSAVSIHPGSGSGWMADRLSGIGTTWLDPGYLGDPLELLLVLAVVFGVAVVLLLRMGAAGDLVLAVAAGGVALVFVRLLLGDVGPVPGVLWAFPLLPMGVAALGRSAIDGPARSLPILTAVLFAGAVVMTQYPQGGSGEWGWRYFAIAVGLVVPVALDQLMEVASRCDVDTRRRLALLGAAGGVGMVMLMSSAVKSVHDVNAAIVASVNDSVEGADPGDGGTPVLVTTVRQIGRLAWADRPDDRWLLVDEADLEAALTKVWEAGVDRVVPLVEADQVEVVESQAATVETDLLLAGGEWRLLVVRG